MTRSESERGAGSILGVGIIAATVFLVGACVPLILIVMTKSQASLAADAAALAAADVRAGIVAGFPCEIARKIAIADGARMASCRLDGLVATVTVTCQIAGLNVEAIATAGPPP